MLGAARACVRFGVLVALWCVVAGVMIVDDSDRSICMIFSQGAPGTEKKVSADQLVRVKVRPASLQKVKETLLLDVCSDLLGECREKAFPLTTSGISLLIERYVALWEFRTNELGFFLNGLPATTPLSVAIDHGICENTLFRTPGGWLIVGENLLDITQHLPATVHTQFEGKIQRLLVPWTPVQVAMAKYAEDGGAALRSIIFRCLPLLARNSGAELIFVPPQLQDEKGKGRAALNALAAAVRSLRVFSSIRTAKWGKGEPRPDVLIERDHVKENDYLIQGQEGGAYMFWNGTYEEHGRATYPADFDLEAIVARMPGTPLLPATPKPSIPHDLGGTAVEETFDYLAKAYVVNLASAKGKYEEARHMLEHHAALPGYKIVRFDAVDGRQVPLTPRVSQLFNTTMHAKNRRNPYEDHGWRQGALGCAMSHVQIWAEIALQTNLPPEDFYLVIEDDARPLFKDDLAAFRAQFLEMYRLAARDHNWDIFYFGFTQDTDLYHDEWARGWGKRAKQFSSAPRSNGGSTFAYAVRRSGALKLLKRAEEDRIHEPIDWFMIDMFGNDSTSLIAYKSVPHVFINPRSTTDRSTTDQVYSIAEADMMVAKWESECAGHRKLQGSSDSSTGAAGEFKMQFIAPAASWNDNAPVITTSHFPVRVELILLGSMPVSDFSEHHKCSKTCYFLSKTGDDVPPLQASKARYCTPVFQRFRDAYIEGVEPGKYTLTVQTFSGRHHEVPIGESTKTFIHVQPEVEPVFVSPRANTMVHGSVVNVSVELAAPVPELFLKEHSFAKVCFMLSGEHIVPSPRFLECKAINDVGRMFRIASVPYGWVALHVFLLDVAGRKFGQPSSVQFYSVSTPTPTALAGYSSSLWRAASLSGALFSCQGHPPRHRRPAPAQAHLALLVLVNRGKTAFRNALGTWRRAGLFDAAQEIVFYFQNFKNGTADRRYTALAPELRDGSPHKHKIKVLGSPSQAGISSALLRMVTAVGGGAGPPVMLFLEEDFAIEEKVPPGGLRAALKSSIDMLTAGTVDNVRLRHRSRPGAPFCSKDVWKGEEELLEMSAHAKSNWVQWEGGERTMKAGNVDLSIWRYSVLNSVTWLGDAEVSDRFYDVLWKCGDGGSHTCAHSTHAGWTNNPSLFRRDWFLENFNLTLHNDWTGRAESAINLSPHVWQWKCFVVAQSGTGVFTHRDTDRALTAQSPCGSNPGLKYKRKLKM